MIPNCLFVHLSVCLCSCVCLSVASHVSETSEAIAIKYDTVTASVMMHHVLIILNLTFIQGHTDLIIDIQLFQKTVWAMSIKFSVKIVWLKVYNNLFSVFTNYIIISTTMKKLQRLKSNLFEKFCIYFS